MKQRILKYDLKGKGKTKINLPECSQVIKVAVQGNWLRLWAAVPVGHYPDEARTFEVIATGKEFGGDHVRCHLATVLNADAVWHIFEVLGHE